MSDINTQKLISFFYSLACDLLNVSGDVEPFKLNVKKATIGEQVNIFLSCYCINPKHVGVLLGSKGHTIRTKDALLKLLHQVGYYYGIHKITLSIEDMSKFPKEEKDDGRSPEASK